MPLHQHFIFNPYQRESTGRLGPKRFFFALSLITTTVSVRERRSPVARETWPAGRGAAPPGRRTVGFAVAGAFSFQRLRGHQARLRGHRQVPREGGFLFKNRALHIFPVKGQAATLGFQEQIHVALKFSSLPSESHEE